MSRPGRKRKQGARYPGGQRKHKPKGEIVEENVRLARSQPHRRGLKSNDRPSELAESSLGRLSLRHVISAGERAAGEAFAAIVGRYRGVIEGPRPVRSAMPETAAEYLQAADDDQNAAPKFDCLSQYADPIEKRLQLVGHAITTREWPCQAAGAVCICAERRERYMRAYEAIAGAGRRALMAVIAVAVRGEEPSSDEIVYLKHGLRAAQRHLGLQDVDR